VGKEANQRVTRYDNPVLQWGRGLTPAEITMLFLPFDQPIFASIGPRTYTRGNSELLADIRALQVPLQWGRGLTSAET